jgi:hypothetical protein
MTTRVSNSALLVRVRLAGFLYLFANLLAPFTLLYLPARFLVRGDPAATAAKILASEGLFRFGIVGNLFTFAGNILLALALYQLLKVADKNMAALMVIFSLVGIPIAMLNEVTQFAVLRLLSGAEYLSVFTPAQLQALALLLLGVHNQGLNIAQLFWGLWLLPMGYLVYKSGFLPRFLGLLLVIAGCGYLAQSLAAFLWPGLGLDIILLTSWGELVLLLWLLIKGVNVEQWQIRAAESAQ